MNAEERYAKNYTALGGKNVAAIPWATLIEALLKLLPAICNTSRGVKRYAKRNPDAVKESMAMVIKDQRDKLHIQDGLAVALNVKAATQAGYDTLLAIPNDELQDMIDKVRR